MTTKNSISAFFMIILIGFFAGNVNAQTTFKPVDSKLKMQDGNKELICSSSSMTIKFPLRREVKILPQDNFVTIDSQTIQIMSLKYDGYSKDTKGDNLNNQKELLQNYSKYELKYFKNELGIEVINPNSQWVVTKSKGWFIWYFKVGRIPIQVDTQTKIQLFATTLIGDNILIINAPILTDGDFSKAALIVNDMMESLIVTK
jgi:hypothetical protein|tara:strand:+ start:7091 stop:7696 length:606 start_codon:yes stop_codon:yes gene_type:complete